jgi:hypothetical protein
MNRRTFLQCTSLTGLGAAAGIGLPRLRGEEPWRPPAVTDLVVPPDGYRPPDWLAFSRTVYFDGYSPPVLPHLDEFDADRLVKLALELGADTLRFQPVGRWAYFPTQSKYPVHPELGKRDLIAETSRACRRAGLHLYCYTNYLNPVMSLDFVEQHPEYLDWVVRGPDGKPFGIDDSIGLGRTPKADSTGDAFRGAVAQIVREFCAYDIDGAYFDAPGCIAYTAFCYCDTCRKKFKAARGMDIDRLRNPDDFAAAIAWYSWFADLQKADLLEYRRLLHGSGKFMFCHNGAAWRPQALREQYRIPDGFMVENQVQVYRRLMAGLMGASMARPTRKVSQMYMGGFSLSDPGLPVHANGALLQDTSEEDGDDILMDGYANLASGGVPLYATLNRLYYGLGGGSSAPAKEIFRFMREHENLIKDSVPVAPVTLVPSWEALQLWRTGRTGWNVPMNEGFTLAALDEGLGLDVCPSTEVTADWLRTRRVIALCGASGLTAAFAGLLAEWVKEGGALLATYDTGLFDENAEIHPGGFLRDVLGVEIMGEALPALPECYYRIQATHPALGQYRSGAVVKGDTRQVPVRAVGSAQVLADCWDLSTKQSRGPAIVANTHGKGRTIYIAGSLEGQYAVTRIASHRRVLGSVLRYLAGPTPAPFTVDAPRGVYAVLRQAPHGDLMLWLLGNVGFKDADIGRMRQEFMAVPNVAVKAFIPEGRTVKAVRLLRSGKSVPFDAGSTHETLRSVPLRWRMAGRYAEVTVPSIHVAEVVHFELA